MLRAMTIPCAVLAGLMLLVGCDGESKGSGSSTNPGGGNDDGIVAVIDLDRVADEIGANLRYRSNLTEAREKARRELQEIQRNLKAQVDPLIEERDAITDEDRKTKLNQQIAAIDQRFRTAIQEKNQEIGRFDQQMKEEFRSSLAPAVKAISDAHGVRVMLMKSQATLHVTPEADLTNELIDELKKNPPPAITTPSTDN